MSPWRALPARDPGEQHRASTPLELLFDLTFVVAVAQAAADLAHSISAGQVTHGLIGYLSVFFAIWWAWMNFSWFASAYDADDVPYRLFTLVQMAGVLVLAGGVDSAFEKQNFLGVTIGYVIMRIAAVVQWLRAASSDPDHAVTARRYAVGIAVVQLGWLVRLAVPPSWPGWVVVFLALIAADLAVPMWAERRGGTPWHPHHIAERYGLFTLIVLGECVLAASTAMRAAVSAGGWSPGLVVVSLSALVLLFGLWWLYFRKAPGDALERRRDLAFLWGYGHYGIFASLAALGAGLEVAGEAVGHHDLPVSTTTVAFSVAAPVVIMLLLLWALHAPLGAAPRRALGEVSIAGALVLLASGATALGLPLAWSVALIAGNVAVLVARAERGADRHADRDAPQGHIFGT